MKALSLVVLFLAPVLNAQDAAPIDFEARRQSVVDLKSHIEMREQRLTEIAADIRSLDDRNEKRIDSIVNSLKDLKDSESTKTRINALKDMRAQARARPVFETMEGWQGSTFGARSYAELPAQAVKYVRRIEELVEAPVMMLSTSPDRDDTIALRDPFAG